MFAFMLKKLAILIAVVAVAVGVGKFAIDNIENISADSAGKVEVTQRSIDSIKDVVELEPIPFKTITKTTSALRSGTQSVVQQGVAGEKTVMYTITYGAGGKELERKKKSEVITKPAINETIVKGTLVVE
jgi:uncharacterized protein YabE (DUF348 family)